MSEEKICLKCGEKFTYRAVPEEFSRLYPARPVLCRKCLRAGKQEKFSNICRRCGREYFSKGGPAYFCICGECESKEYSKLWKAIGI